MQRYLCRDMSNTEVEALISLLDDPDDRVYEQISDKLFSMGESVIPSLENAWENSFDVLIQQRIEGIIHKIQFEKIFKEIIDWSKNDSTNLLKGALIMARYQYPDLEEERIYKHLDQIKQDVWLELNNNLTALEKIRVFNHIFFDVHCFSGNTANYHAPQNSYINNVLESKKGNPLSLSILYAVIAQDLNIPIYGVNLPEHFILCYMDVESNRILTQDDSSDKILFYINPFSKGTVFGKKEIDMFLKQLKLNPDPTFYQPCNNIEIIKRLIRNLVNAYEKLGGYDHKIKELQKILAAL